MIYQRESGNQSTLETYIAIIRIIKIMNKILHLSNTINNREVSVYLALPLINIIRRHLHKGKEVCGDIKNKLFATFDYFYPNLINLS